MVEETAAMNVASDSPALDAAERQEPVVPEVVQPLEDLAGSVPENVGEPRLKPPSELAQEETHCEMDGEGAIEGDTSATSGDTPPVTPELLESIRKQVEFYFSDLNLPTDKHLLKQIKKDPEGYVALKVIANFKRVKSMTKDIKVVAQALEGSELLAVSDDHKKVRRVVPVPEYDLADIQRRTVFVENLPETPTIESMTQVFAQYGTVKMVRICSKGANSKLPAWLVALVSTHSHSQQFALVEYSTEQEAETAIRELGAIENWRTGLKVRPLLRKGVEKQHSGMTMSSQGTNSRPNSRDSTPQGSRRVSELGGPHNKRMSAPGVENVRGPLPHIRTAVSDCHEQLHREPLTAGSPMRGTPVHNPSPRRASPRKGPPGSPNRSISAPVDRELIADVASFIDKILEGPTNPETPPFGSPRTSQGGALSPIKTPPMNSPTKAASGAGLGHPLSRRQTSLSHMAIPFVPSCLTDALHQAHEATEEGTGHVDEGDLHFTKPPRPRARQSRTSSHHEDEGHGDGGGSRRSSLDLCRPSAGGARSGLASASCSEGEDLGEEGGKDGKGKKPRRRSRRRSSGRGSMDMDREAEKLAAPRRQSLSDDEHARVSSGGKAEGVAKEKRPEKKDYASWAAATPEFRAQATKTVSIPTGSRGSSGGGAKGGTGPHVGSPGLAVGGSANSSYLAQRLGGGFLIGTPPGGSDKGGVHRSSGGMGHEARVPRGPDGTKGFSLGRGKPIPGAL